MNSVMTFGVQEHLRSRKTTCGQRINPVDEDCTGGEPLSKGEYNSNPLVSFTYVLNEIEHVKLAVAG